MCSKKETEKLNGDEISIEKVVRTARKNKKYTRKKVAEAVGISLKTYAKYETERFEQSVITALKIAEFLDFSWEDMARAGLQGFEYQGYDVRAAEENFLILNTAGELVGMQPLSRSRIHLEAWIDGHIAGYFKEEPAGVKEEPAGECPVKSELISILELDRRLRELENLLQTT